MVRLVNPAGTYSSLTMETPEQRKNKHNRTTSATSFIVNFEHTSHVVLLFPLITLNK